LERERGTPSGERGGVQSKGRELKEQEHLFSQWEHERLNIQQLSATLTTETYDLLKLDI